MRYWDALAVIDKRALAQEAYVRHVCLAMNDAFQSISSTQVRASVHVAATLHGLFALQKKPHSSGATELLLACAKHVGLRMHPTATLMWGAEVHAWCWCAGSHSTPSQPGWGAVSLQDGNIPV